MPTDQNGGMCFEPSEEVELIKQSLDEFIEQEIVPLEEEYDQFLGEDAERNMVDDDGYPVDEYVELRNEITARSIDAGFYTMYMPERVGGGGVTSVLDRLLIREHLHNRNPDGFHELIFDGFSVSRGFLPCYEDEYMREEFVEPLFNGEKRGAFGLTEPDHGSDITYMDTTAEKDGDEWVIDGTKAFISNAPYADVIMVHARTSGEDGDAHGISSFVVDADNPGYELGRAQRPMGTRPGRQAICHFNNCRVPDRQMIGDEGEGFIETAIKSVGGARLNIPAKACGRAQWMFEQCVDYAENRIAFDEPIGDKQFVKGMLAELRADIEQVRWLYRHTAWRFDQGENPRWEQSAAKLRGSELWNDAADTAVQIHGGAGWMRSLPFEGEYREARAARIYDGTDQIQKRTIADQFLSTE